MEGGWQGEEEDWIPDTSSPPQIFLFFWNIPPSAIIKRATVSDCGISTSGEGRDFSEIIAMFLTRNKRVYATVGSWGGEGAGGVAEGGAGWGGGHWAFSPSSLNVLVKVQAG